VAGTDSRTGGRSANIARNHNAREASPLMFTPWKCAADAIRTRLVHPSRRARPRRRPASLSTAFEWLEFRKLLTANAAIPYWSGNWTVSSPDFPTSPIVFLSGTEYNYDASLGWDDITMICYGCSSSFAAFYPNPERNTDNATISGILIGSNFPGVAPTSLGTFKFTADANSSPGSIPDTFTGTYTLNGGQPERYPPRFSPHRATRPSRPPRMNTATWTRALGRSIRPPHLRRVLRLLRPRLDQVRLK
jgi:hypothetical protein